MKKTAIKFSTCILAFFLLCTSCKKNKDNDPDDLTESTHSGDEATFQQETDQIAADVSDALSGVHGFSGARIGGAFKSLCSIQMDSLAPDSLKMTFIGNTCDGRRQRSGYVIVKLTNGRWKDVNATATIFLYNVKIVRNRDGKSLVLNGTKTIKNLSGGLFKQLADGSKTDPLIHEITAAIIITFDDLTQRSWTSHRKRTISKSGNDYEIQIEGMGSDGTHAGIVASGITRNGLAFYTLISTPIRINSCGVNDYYNWTVVQGVREHYLSSGRNVTVTFGVDMNGNAVNSCSAYGYKANWTSAKGKTFQIIGQY